MRLNPRKLMPIAHFQLPMSKNYVFTKTKDCLRTSVVGCLTPSTHITRLLNSKIKIFYPSILDQKKCPFSQPRIGNKIKQSQVTNHALENPMIGSDFTYPCNFLKIDLYSSHTPEVRHTSMSIYSHTKKGAQASL